MRIRISLFPRSHSIIKCKVSRDRDATDSASGGGGMRFRNQSPSTHRRSRERDRGGVDKQQSQQRDTESGAEDRSNMTADHTDIFDESRLSGKSTEILWCLRLFLKCALFFFCDCKLQEPRRLVTRHLPEQMISQMDIKCPDTVKDDTITREVIVVRPWIDSIPKLPVLKSQLGRNRLLEMVSRFLNNL